MIVAGTRLRIRRVPLERIVVSEHQVRYPDRVLHYVRLLSDPAHAQSDPGLVALAPIGRGLYTLLDGHHRYVAAILTGRCDLLAVIHTEPTEPREPRA